MARKRFLVTLKNNSGEEETLVVYANGRRFAIAKAQVLCPGFQPASFIFTAEPGRIDEFVRTGVRQKSRYDNDILLRFR